MSRIGKQPVAVPEKVKVSVAGATVTIEGPKGKISRTLRPEVAVKFSQPDSLIKVERKGDEAFDRAYHGTTRAHLANMIRGVSSGFERALSIVGVGYNAKLQGKKYGLVISDWNMEPMTGYDLLREVRASPEFSQTPFIMITAESKTENVIAAKKAGVSNYIVKPFNAATLKAKMEAVFPGAAE